MRRSTRFLLIPDWNVILSSGVPRYAKTLGQAVWRMAQVEFSTCNDTRDLVLAYSQSLIGFLRMLLESTVQVRPDDRPSPPPTRLVHSKDRSARILEMDRNLSFMPLIFSIHLKRTDGSFIPNTN
ncbi:hypothetical protein BJX68DRAFT_265746 [Aspergillus pseudodeflectus]|uniref:PIN domain-containing protein n=1 Tax=Aspergillus pseudodeflectus TaxID=176178 RepID=A0ABR4KIX2_9EURO